MMLLTTFTLLAIILVALYGAGVNGLQCCDLGGGCSYHKPESCKHAISCVPIQCSMVATTLDSGKDADGENEA